LQLLKNQVPLSLLHLAEFLDIDFDLDNEQYNRENMTHFDASQVFIRAEVDGFEITKKFSPGFYELGDEYNLVSKKAGYNINQASSVGEILVLTRFTGMKLKQGDEIARIQLLQEAADHNYNVHPWIIEALTYIKNELQ
jgi:hypothetical protein